MASGKGAEPDGVEVEGLLAPNDDFRYPIPVPNGIFSRMPLDTGPEGRVGADFDSGVGCWLDDASSALTLLDNPLGPDRDPRRRAANAAANASPVGGDLPVKCDAEGGEPEFGEAFGCGNDKNGSDMDATPGVPA